jgi:hypothetical protein
MASCHDAHFLLCARPESAHFHRRSSSFRIREERTGEEISSTVGTGSNEQSHGFFIAICTSQRVAYTEGGYIESYEHR